MDMIGRENIILGAKGCTTLCLTCGPKKFEYPHKKVFCRTLVFFVLVAATRLQKGTMLIRKNSNSDIPSQTVSLHYADSVYFESFNIFVRG
jgi:hypothetical protein